MNQTGHFYDPALFFEISPDLLCIAGYDGYFKRVNATVSKLLGYSETELLSSPINEFVHPEDREITSRHREKLKQGIPLLNFENRYLTHKGETLWLSWTSVPFVKQEVIYAIAKDITHHKHLEADRNRLLTNLAQVNQDLKQLSYTTSHDLRAPVHNLMGILALMDHSKIQDEETSQFLKLIWNSAEVLQYNLNKQLDQLSLKEQQQANWERIPLQEIFDEVRFSLNHLLQQSNTQFELDFSACQELTFKRAYLESILLNLISNSIKYACPGVSPRISLMSRHEDHRPQLIYRDNGLGFDLPKVKNQIFGLGQSFHDHHDSKGIGLYLVHKHLTNLGGRIELKSQPNQGSEFTLYFPRRF